MIVSNTSPLRYLIGVGAADLLPKLFHDVLIAPAVLKELTHPSGREDVRRWVEQCPDWLVVRNLRYQPSNELLAVLDLGESETIQLALETGPDFVLMDERLGRKTASSSGLTVIGALGVLRESYRRGHTLEPLLVLDRMRKIGFRISQSLHREFRQSIEAISAGQART